MAGSPGNITVHLNVLDTIPILILDVDRFGNLLFCNQKAREILQIPVDTSELEDLHLGHYLDPPSHKSALKFLEQLFSGEGDLTVVWGLALGGKEVIVNVNAVTIYENDYAVRVRMYMHPPELEAPLYDEEPLLDLELDVEPEPMRPPTPPQVAPDPWRIGGATQPVIPLPTPPPQVQLAPGPILSEVTPAQAMAAPTLVPTAAPTSEPPPQPPQPSPMPPELDETVHQDREYLHALLHRSGLLVYVFDTRKTLIEVNRRMIEVTGFDPRTTPTLEQLLAGLYPDPSQRVEVHKLHNDIHRAKHMKNQELKVRTRSGETRYIAWSSGHLRDSKGRTAGYIVTGVDVTEKKQLERWLRTQSALVAQVFEAVVVTDRMGRIVKWLGSAERLFGQPARAMMGRSLFDLVPELRREAFKAALTQALAKEGRFAANLLLRGAQERPFAARIQVSQLKGEDDQPIGLSALFLDQTREKQLEAAMKERAPAP